jgi:nucleotide-binding universal stress UspA family protein
MDKILLPTDGSKSALKAAEYVAQLMKHSPSIEVTILAVEDDQVLGDKVIKRTQGIFDQAGLTVKTIINKGVEEVGDIIVYYANNGPYNHVVMGRRGLSILQNIFMGSVSNKVVKKAQVPVTMVPISPEK